MAAFGLVTIGASLHFLKISLHFPKMQGISARDRFASDWLDGTFSSPKNPCQTGAFSNRVSFVNGFLSPPQVTVLSAVGIIRRNIWSEAQVLQCPQRAGIQ